MGMPDAVADYRDKIDTHKRTPKRRRIESLGLLYNHCILHYMQGFVAQANDHHSSAQLVLVYV